MSFKRTKVVMLPTNEKAPLILGTSKNGKLAISNSSICNGAYIQNQHLHFLSDDEIKEGDWVYRFNSKDIFKADSFLIHLIEKGSTENCKKIIATTGKNLMWLDKSEKNPELARPNGLWKCLPQPSEGFIQKFVDSYNSGKPITEVDVEYEKIKQALSVIPKKTKNGTDYTEVEWEFQETLKVNPKDNTITIKKVKDSWSREEVINLLQQFNNDKSGVFDCTGWIEENL
jgi:hypothetical protein